MIEELTIAVLVFAAVCLVVWSLRNMLSGTGKETSASYPLWFRLLSPGIFFFAGELGGFLEKTFARHSAKMREELKKAALAVEVPELYGAAVLLALLGIILGVMLAFSLELNLAPRLFIAVVPAVIGGLYPQLYVTQTAEKRIDEILHNLPFAIDLISSSMRAGLDFGAAVRYLVSTGRENVLKKEFSVFLRDVELGKTRTDALKDMQERISAVEFTRFVSAISYGIDSGSSIIDIMRIQAEEMRRVKYARAERQAAKAPAKMIVPMVLFIFPAIFIIILVPVLIQAGNAGILNMMGK